MTLETDTHYVKYSRADKPPPSYKKKILTLIGALALFGLTAFISVMAMVDAQDIWVILGSRRSVPAILVFLLAVFFVGAAIVGILKLNIEEKN